MIKLHIFIIPTAAKFFVSAVRKRSTLDFESHQGNTTFVDDNVKNLSVELSAMVGFYLKSCCNPCS